MNWPQFTVAILDGDTTTPYVVGRTLTRLFGKVPFRVDVYHSIAAAKERLADPTDPVDLWIIDGGRVGGVDVNGFCSVLKAHQASFLRMTGDPGHVDEGLEGSPLGDEQVAGVLVKPFELSDLQARVHAFILAKTVAL